MYARVSALGVWRGVLVCWRAVFTFAFSSKCSSGCEIVLLVHVSVNGEVLSSMLCYPCVPGVWMMGLVCWGIMI